MSIVKNIIDTSSMPIPSFCLSPDETNSSSETENFAPNSELFVIYENEAETALPLSSLDLLNFVLPPTPEGSDDLESGYDAAFSFEDIFTESDAAGISQSASDIRICQTDLEEPLLKVTPTNSKPGKQADLPTDVFSSSSGHKARGLLPNKSFGENEQGNFLSSMNMNLESNKGDQNKSKTVAGTDISQEQTNRASFETIVTKSTVKKRNSLNKGLNAKRSPSYLLKFPPCVICCGKSSGSHYGAITCEACKGFFRRYLQQKKDFKCTKGGKCEILSSKRGNCSGCRLKKCLALGMSKEKSKLGRYTLTERTEAIISMNRLEGKLAIDSVSEKSDELADENGIDANSYNLETDIIKRYLLQNTNTVNVSNGFNDMLVTELVQAMDDLEPYGPYVKTKEQIDQIHKRHSERFKLKTELFGKMKTVPKDEYNRLYKEFGIDIDGRMADMKLEFEDIEGDIERYCNFAKHIPGFQNLPVQDQSKLLKTLMVDFFSVVMVDCYNDEYRTFISKNGHGYHFDEIADREYSGKLLALLVGIYRRWQMLNLSKEETALVSALSLFSTDRCNLKKRAGVEKIQLALTELLQIQIKKKEKRSARGRLTKIIDTLTYMRDMCELFTKENNLLCKEDLYQQEFPCFVDFIVEETE